MFFNQHVEADKRRRVEKKCTNVSIAERWL